MLLPHGYEGQGANHSYAHLHRFLALAANDNMRIVYPTVSSQYFHLLRQQAAENSDDVRPLVLMAPKSLLRHPLAACSPGDLADGTFRPLIVDSRGPADSPGRLILCTGKVWADLVSSDEYQKSGPVTVIRLEQLYPFPERELAETLVQRLPVTSIIWLQEEPQNRGAWAFVRPKLESILGDRSQAIEYVGRPPMASPSEGAHWAHKANQDKLIKRALGAA